MPVPYKLSGKAGGAPVLLVLSVVVGLIGGYISWTVTWYIDAVKLKFLVDMVFGLGVAGAIYGLALVLKCRSLLLVTLASIAAGVLGTLTGFSVLIENCIPGVSLTQFMFSPTAVWEALNAINNAGIFVKNNRPVDMWFYWAMEGLAFLCATAILAPVLLKKRAFCENCKRWISAEKKLGFEVPQKPELLEELKKGSLLPLLELASKPPTAFPVLRLEYWLCPTCGNTGTYRLVLAAGAEANALQELTKLLIIDAEVAEQLGKVLSKAETPAAPAPQSQPNG